MKVYAYSETFSLLNEQHTLDGGDMLTGFLMELCERFAEPRREETQ